MKMESSNKQSQPDVAASRSPANKRIGRPPVATRPRTRLNAGFCPGPIDVICAKGSAAYSHSGNRWFRHFIEQQLPRYVAATSRIAKSAVVTETLVTVRAATPRGGFVRCIDGEWFEIGDIKAREKISQAFRDSVGAGYKSSSKAKQKKKLQRSSATSVSQSSVSQSSVSQSNGSQSSSTSSDSSSNINGFAFFTADDDDDDESCFFADDGAVDMEPLPFSATSASSILGTAPPVPFESFEIALPSFFYEELTAYPFKL